MLVYIVIQMSKVNHEKGYCTGLQIKQSGIESCSEQNTLLLQYFSPSGWMVYGCQMVGGTLRGHPRHLQTLFRLQNWLDLHFVWMPAVWTAFRVLLRSDWPWIVQGIYSESHWIIVFQVENILRSDRGDFVLCDYGSATRKVVYPQVSLKSGSTCDVNDH